MRAAPRDQADECLTASVTNAISGSSSVATISRSCSGMPPPRRAQMTRDNCGIENGRHQSVDRARHRSFTSATAAHHAHDVVAASCKGRYRPCRHSHSHIEHVLAAFVLIQTSEGHHCEEWIRAGVGASVAAGVVAQCAVPSAFCPYPGHFRCKVMTLVLRDPLQRFATLSAPKNTSGQQGSDSCAVKLPCKRRGAHSSSDAAHLQPPQQPATGPHLNGWPWQPAGGRGSVVECTVKA